MPTTSNFGWTTPADTDLVKDGAAAIRTLGNGIDTSFLDLKGGTTGQVLSKASNTDLDFSWVAVDPLTILDAKGDLISATAADTPARLAVGANGTVLTADSTTSTGLKWATAGGGGKVLQVVQGTTTTETVISSTTYTDSNITATITPTSATSTILVMVSGTIRCRRTSFPTTVANRTRLLRGATVAQERLNTVQLEVDTTATEDALSVQTPFTFMYQDSPATTSATTYKIQGALAGAAGTLTFQYDSTAATIILMEIGA